MDDKDLQLHDGSRVGILGGGPAGSPYSILIIEKAKRKKLPPTLRFRRNYYSREYRYRLFV